MRYLQIKELEMCKILSALIAGLFAVSAFAADAPKPTTPDTKPAAEAAAPAKAEVKKPHMARKHHKKTAKKTEAAAPVTK